MTVKFGGCISYMKTYVIIIYLIQYADDVRLIARNATALNDNYDALEGTARKLGLEASTDKRSIW